MWYASTRSPGFSSPRAANGCRIELRHASPELRELIAFMGLEDVLAGRAGLGLEPRRQPEQREEPLGDEEERELADLPPATSTTWSAQGS